MQPQFIYIETFGCAANYNNSEIVKGLLIQAGLELTNNPEIADILIINTCIVKGKTENRIERKIQDLLKYNKPLIVAGCMPEVRKINFSIYVLGTHNFRKILNLIKDIAENRTSEEIGNYYLKPNKEIKLNLPKLKQRKTIGITQISEGCNQSCSYCLVQKAKGKLFTYPQQRIIDNIKADLASGCKEIWLTSQDNAAYQNLPELINKITAIPANFKLRIGMMNPNHILPILPALIQAYKNYKVYKFLHIPIQSGSDKILKTMDRQYTTQQARGIIKKFKQAFPDISIATDFIVNYPGESEKDYQQTLSLLKEISPDIVNVSRYWPMKNTPAAQLKQLPVEQGKKRAKQLHDLHLSISKENYEKYKLQHQQVWALINDKLGKSFLARDDNYKLIVLNQPAYLNKFVKVKLGKVYPHYFIGEIV